MAKNRICDAPSCGKPSKRTYCDAHYKRLKKYGSFDLPIRIPQGCKVEGCTRKHDAKGYCKPHYLKWRRHGDPLRQIVGLGAASFFEEVLPYRGKDCLFWKFGRNKKGYAQVRIDGVDGYVHRFACIEVNGPPPSADHIALHDCGNGHLGCVAPLHTYWGLRSDNQIDRVVHDEVYGRECSSAKLTTDDVRQIRVLSGKMTATAIGEMFGVNRRTVRDAIARRTWYWLD